MLAMKKLCFLFVGTVLPVLARASGIFLEQPQNMTVEESGNATFRCSLLNSSFNILWLVDDFYAGYRMYYERGIAIQSINSTTSELYIVGHRINHLSRVQCVALLTDKYTYELLDDVKSEVALLIVLDADQNNKTVNPSTVSWTMNNITGVISTWLNIPYSPPKAAPSTASEWNKKLLAGAAGLLLPFVIVIIILLFICRILLKKYRGMVKPEESPSDNIVMKSNVVYEHTSMKCEQNPAYDTVTPRIKQVH